MKKLLFLVGMAYCLNPAFAQNVSKSQSFPQQEPGIKRKKFYFLWGYNRDWYAKSTIHIRNTKGDPELHNQYGVYDMYLYNVKAHDKGDFSGIADIVNITIPQFNFRIGFTLSDKRNDGLELNYDHAKYVVDDWQTAHTTGTIFGKSFDKDTLLNPANFHYEHTDGANFWNINYFRRWDLIKNSNEKYKLNFVAKAGAGIVMPRTDITIFGHRLNNDWHIAGVCANVETGLRGLLWKHFVIEATGKAVLANYMSCLVQGKGNGQASQIIKCTEVIVTAGYQF